MARTKKTDTDATPKARTPRAKKAKVAKSEATGSVVDVAKYKGRYSAHDEKTASGRKSVDVGDRLAKALRGMTADATIKAVGANGGKVNPKWKEINPGLARMAAGNVLRGLVRQGKTIEIDGTKIASL